MLRFAMVLVLGVLLVGLVACGASGSKPSTTAAQAARYPASPGSKPSTTAAQPARYPAPATSAAAVGASCRQVATNELADVARRVYAQAVHGGGVVSAVTRLQRNPALATAVAGGRRGAVAAAFLPLRHQIIRIELFDRTHRVYSYGRKPSFAPVRGDLHDAGGRVVGHFILAATDQRAYAGLMQRLAGADTVFRTGTRAAATRKGFHTTTLATQAYPSGPMHIDVQIPTPPSSLCGTGSADTRLRTIGFVGRRLLAAEGNSRAVDQTLRFAASNPAFRAATAAGDPAAIRAVIVREFFGDHSHHIVRVRVTRGSQLIYDLGGPYVLQPATGTVRSPDGRTSATFTLAVQDDTGYIKLMHRFTGAAVQLTSPLGRVPGSTLTPGPDQIPAHGPVTYGGRRYLADSYTGTAFPSGTLRISLLIPA